MVIGAIVAFVGAALIGNIVYDEWRNFTRLGVYQFNSTGKIVTRREKESRRVANSRRNQLVTVTNHYMSYRTLDGQYSFEKRVKPEQAQRYGQAMRNGTIYTLQREVFVDRNGAVAIRELSEEGKETSGYLTRCLTFFIVFVLPGCAVMLFARRRLTASAHRLAGNPR
jgi:hypothetical protein